MYASVWVSVYVRSVGVSVHCRSSVYQCVPVCMWSAGVSVCVFMCVYVCVLVCVLAWGYIATCVGVCVWRRREVEGVSMGVH